MHIENLDGYTVFKSHALMHNEERFDNGDFNEEQIEFLNQQRLSFLSQRDEQRFDHDNYERDMWYTMNRSGLFEDINWTPSETRCYITNQ